METNCVHVGGQHNDNDVTTTSTFTLPTKLGRYHIHMYNTNLSTCGILLWMDITDGRCGLMANWVIMLPFPCSPSRSQTHDINMHCSTLSKMHLEHRMQPQVCAIALLAAPTQVHLGVQRAARADRDDHAGSDLCQIVSALGSKSRLRCPRR
jgi:hypothetical protein